MKTRDPFPLFTLVRKVNLFVTWIVFQEKVIPYLKNVQCKSWMAMVTILSYSEILL